MWQREYRLKKRKEKIYILFIKPCLLVQHYLVQEQIHEVADQLTQSLIGIPWDQYQKTIFRAYDQ